MFTVGSDLKVWKWHNLIVRTPFVSDGANCRKTGLEKGQLDAGGEECLASCFIL